MILDNAIDEPESFINSVSVRLSPVCCPSATGYARSYVRTLRLPIDAFFPLYRIPISAFRHFSYGRLWQQ